MPKIPTIKGNNFILRGLDVENDKTSMMKNINEPDIMSKLTIDYPYTEEHWKWLVNNHKDIITGKSSNINFMIDVDGEVVGSIGITIDGKNSSKHVGKFGYWLAKNHWGKGIMSEAVKLVSDYAFKDLELKRLEIGFLADNKGSARVAEKNGFKFEYREVRATFKNSEYKDLVTTIKFAEGF